MYSGNAAAATSRNTPGSAEPTTYATSDVRPGRSSRASTTARLALLGDVDDCLRVVEDVRAIGVDDIACLVDFGVPADAVLPGLERLCEVRRRALAASGTVPA